jgi:hypothetical protein
VAALVFYLAALRISANDKTTLTTP